MKKIIALLTKVAGFLLVVCLWVFFASIILSIPALLFGLGDIWFPYVKLISLITVTSGIIFMVLFAVFNPD